MAERKTLNIAYTAICAAIITVCAWITIPMTIPFTLQTLGICVVAGLFGAKLSALSLAVYVAIGAIGVPVFSGFKGGLGVIFGSTGGYMLGFFFTALIVGVVSDKFKGRAVPLFISMIVGIAVCYVFGTAWFAVVYARQNATPAALGTILGWCVVPFIIPDIVKAVVATVLVNRLKGKIKTTKK